MLIIATCFNWPSYLLAISSDSKFYGFFTRAGKIWLCFVLFMALIKFFFWTSLPLETKSTISHTLYCFWCVDEQNPQREKRKVCYICWITISLSLSLHPLFPSANMTFISLSSTCMKSFMQQSAIKSSSVTNRSLQVCISITTCNQSELGLDTVSFLHFISIRYGCFHVLCFVFLSGKTKQIFSNQNGTDYRNLLLIFLVFVLIQFITEVVDTYWGAEGQRIIA